MADIISVHHLDLVLIDAAVADQRHGVAFLDAQARETLVVLLAIAEFRLGQAIDIHGTCIVHQIEVAVLRIDCTGNLAGQLVLLRLGRFRRDKVGYADSFHLAGSAALAAAFAATARAAFGGAIERV